MFVLKSVILAPDESFENKTRTHDSLMLESDPDFKPQEDSESVKKEKQKPKPVSTGLSEILLWSKSELNELISIQDAIKHFHKQEGKIETLAAKHKIS